MSRPTTDDLVARTAAAVLLDAYLDGDRLYWLRRARAFAAVGTPACDEIALACRNRAEMTDTALADLAGALVDLTGAAA